MRSHFGHVPALDGIRGVAVLLVMFAHADWVVPGGGTVGVTVFFVLSGFLITSLLLRELDARGRIDLPSFYGRRVLRLYPALVTLVAATVVWLVATGQRGLVGHETVPALFYYANFVRADGGWLNELNHTWTLAIEEQFYLVWPALILIAGGRPRWIALIAGTGALGAAIVRLVAWSGPASIPFEFFSTFARADGILLGCLLAIMWRRLPALRSSSWIGVAGLALVIVASVPRDQTWLYVWAPFAAELGAVGMILWAMDRPGPLGWRPLALTGRLSYSLYLWSPPIMLWVLPRLHLSGLALDFGLSFAAAIASYLLVERPFLSLKGRWTARVERANAAA